MYFVSSLIAVLALSIANAHPNGALYRVNVGGGSYTDSLGHIWSEDSNYNTGNVYQTSAPISGTSDPELYQTERWDPGTLPELKYSFAVSSNPSVYQVLLHFADIFSLTHAVGNRVFDVKIEDNGVFTGLDIFAEAGGYAALIKNATVSVGDGTLDIELVHQTENPKLSAIEVIPLSPTAVAVATTLQGAVPLEVGLNALASFDPQGGPLLYQWDFGDGSPVNNTADPTHIYTVTGTYTATLTVTDNQSYTDTETVTVVVGATAATPTAVIKATPTTGDQSLVVKFDGSDSSSQGGSLTFNWNFGDGSGSNSANPTHIYHDVGTYLAILTVTDAVGFSNTVNTTIAVNTVHNPATVLYRINVGGPDYVDSMGQQWQADTMSNTGSTYATSSDVTGTSDPALYQSERWDPGVLPELKYSLPVAPTANLYLVRLYFADIYSLTHAVGKRVFDVAVEDTVVFNNLDIYAEVGGYAALTKTVTLEVTDGTLDIELLHEVENPKISAIEVYEYDPTHSVDLHVVIIAPTVVVDYDGDGLATVRLDGTDSHTHEPGRTLAGFEWSISGVIIATTELAEYQLPLGGPYTVYLTIRDDNSPPKYLTDSVQVEVRAPHDVPGNLVYYYQGVTSLNSNPPNADFAEVTPGLALTANEGHIGTSRFTGNVLVKMLFAIDISTTDTYQFQLAGGSSHSLSYFGQPVTGPVILTAGRHQFIARFIVATLSDLPLKVTLAQGSDPFTVVNPSQVTHNETGMLPVINAVLPANGSALGGDILVIHGLGFFPSSQVTVEWGSDLIANNNLTVTPTGIRLLTPPGNSTVTVRVVTPNGASNAATYNYKQNLIPIDFTKTNILGVNSPTSLEWGPDGRLYIGTINGVIKIVSFGQQYVVNAVQTVDIISTLPNPSIMGLAFNPFDPPGTVNLYVSHSTLYAQGGGCFTGASPYPGQVSRLTGPDFNLVEPVITGLASSNHDHLVNGMQFDANGDLLVSIGGNTNAGVEACAIGGIPESPLSAAVVKAHLSRPDFNGIVSYVVTNTGVTDNDQVSGNIVSLDPSVEPYFSIYASGLRNSWDLVLTTKGHLYATDNGPNVGFGASSTSATTQSSDPYAGDELLRLEKGQYAGHPNRNRGRYDARENVYRGVTGPSIGGDVFTQQIAMFPASTNGIVEYRANTFNGGMRGDLLLQKWNDQTFRVTLSPDGTATATVTTLPVSLTSLDVTTGPGGVLFGSDLSGSAVWLAKPNDAGATGSNMLVYDITPWRGSIVGGTPFIIGGTGFGTLAGTTVAIGGITATVTGVTGTRIYGVTPAGVPGPSVHVSVTSLGKTQTLTSAFQYLAPISPGPADARAIVGPSLPVAVGRVATGLINGIVYLVGSGSPATLTYNTANGAWATDAAATRIHQGEHHAAETVNNKLYLFGGSGASAGKVQIYNPVADVWTLGSPMPWSGFSVATAKIGGLIYVAGGIVGTSTVTNHASYNPDTDTWSSLAPMPQGRNHAASGTDGVRFYVFGGRGPGSGDANVVANGFDTLQIYDPVTNSWTSSETAGSGLTPLPQARGGTGRAVYHKGEFYVMGGETLTGEGANSDGVYDRVDVYGPVTNTWRQENSMITARHGIAPVMVGERCFVAGGGTVAGASVSDHFEIIAF